MTLGGRYHVGTHRNASVATLSGNILIIVIGASHAALLENIFFSMRITSWSWGMSDDFQFMSLANGYFSAEMRGRMMILSPSMQMLAISAIAIAVLCWATLISD